MLGRERERERERGSERERERERVVVGDRCLEEQEIVFGTSRERGESFVLVKIGGNVWC